MRAIGSQVALARHESPTMGDEHVALAASLTRHLPETLAALTAGRITEEAAAGVHRTVNRMDPALASRVDALIAPGLGHVGPRALVESARRAACAIDEDAAARRARAAVGDRRVTLRAAADGMAYLTLYAPMTEATGAFSAVYAEASAGVGLPRFPGRGHRSAFWLDEQPRSFTGPVETETSGAMAPMSAVDGRLNVVSGGHSAGMSAGRLSGTGAGRSAPAGAGARTRSQLMADVVVSRLTGRAVGQPVPIEIQLVLTDRSLQGQHDVAATGSLSTPGHDSDRPRTATFSRPSGSDERSSVRARPDAPVKVIGAGWLPATLAREVIDHTAHSRSSVTVRRVLTDPSGSTVTGLEARRRPLSPTNVGEQSSSRADTGLDQSTVRDTISTDCRTDTLRVVAATGSAQRYFRGVLRQLVVVRDQTCRTPWCGAAIRAIDHVTPHRRAGPTSAANAQGVCERCNYTKESPGWTVVAERPGWPAPDRDRRPPWQQVLDDLVADDPPAYGRATRADPEDGAVPRTVVVTPTGHRYASLPPGVCRPS